MQRGTKISNQAQDMDGTECLGSDLLAKVKGECDQQKNVEADNAQPHPKRTIGVDKGNEDLEDIERQILIEQ